MPYKDPEKRRAHHRKYMREVWYPKNRKAHKERVKKNNEKKKVALQQKLYEYLARHPCVDCGEDDIVVLQFDHVQDAKAANVADLVRDRVSWARVEVEIERCEIRCANCHTRKTAKQFSWAKLNAQDRFGCSRYGMVARLVS